MRTFRKEIILDIFYLILFLAVVVVWGVSFVMTIIEYSDFMAVLSVVSYFAVFVGIFLIEKRTNRYKWKYIFLGKKFKKQVDDFFKNHKEFSKKEKRAFLKTMKKTYRQTGGIRFATYHYQMTPYKLWSADYVGFDYGNALEEQKVEYMLYLLQINIDDGGELYRFFEELTNEPFTYEEYKKLIDGSKLFSKELKELLLKPEYEKIFEYFKRYNSLSDEEHKELEMFELNDSNLIAEFDVELFKTVENLSVKMFLGQKQKDGLPPHTKRLFMSKDNAQRIAIFKDEQTGTYKVSDETFIFYDDESSIMHSEGCWSPSPNSVAGTSFYETIELAINEHKKQIEKLEEIKI